MAVNGSKKGRKCKAWDERLVSKVESGWREGRLLACGGRIEHREFEWEGKTCESEDLVCEWLDWLDEKTTAAPTHEQIVEFPEVDEADLPF